MTLKQRTTDLTGLRAKSIHPINLSIGLDAIQKCAAMTLTSRPAAAVEK